MIKVLSFYMRENKLVFIFKKNPLSRIELEPPEQLCPTASGVLPLNYRGNKTMNKHVIQSNTASYMS